MRLVIAVVQDKDSGRLAAELVKRGYRATKLASTGGFLKAGNTTFLVGVDDERVNDVVECIHRSCRAREQVVTPFAPVGNVDAEVPVPISVQVGGATVFVLDVERFEHF
ncbi:cyclic-di-AMP receptor [Kyrpidia spormannii]|uniref:Signal transduction receptor, cyclic di-AMP binding n=2 Tax=Kyrpidia spormannii TaxID=2055160 RepID=A0ACA8Z499_9BACL|nr:cyclic-di-AMP receptor [Kyrpidia spormannii]CAB3389221.1 signal transduction receptor, cyclic di-AMP binding [Kyrpidia spormannii]CAB3389704.1 signal transduction receptor, cyclic di-AMP binding [Kyrpidia spormannii]